MSQEEYNRFLNAEDICCAECVGDKCIMYSEPCPKLIDQDKEQPIKEVPLSEQENTIVFICRGCNFTYRQSILSNYFSSNHNGEDNSYLTLKKEPSNKYDPNAIQVICRGEVYGTIGYVGKEYTLQVASILKISKSYTLTIYDDIEVGCKEIQLKLSWVPKEDQSFT